ncbi:MAG: carbohydrate ABC transporter permease [Anaerolineales bacterium]
MSTSYKGWRKTVLLLVLIVPTLVSITLISLYPIFYNVYISFTNRSRFHYQPPESIWRCDPETMGQYCWQEPLFGNYIRLFGPLLQPRALLAWGKLLLLFAPFALIYVQKDRRREPRLSSDTTDTSPMWWWLAGLAASALLWFLLDVRSAVTLLLDTGDFFVVMFRTFLYVLVCIPFFILVGGILALILNNRAIQGKGVFRTLLILPWAIPSYITAEIWKFFFQEQGAINQLLTLVGVQGPTWLQHDALAFVSVVIINIWLSYPFFMTVILGGLQAIPLELYDAADVDGATWRQKLTHVTIPHLRPTVMPAIVLSAITTFQMFNMVWLVTEGGPIRGAGKPGATQFVMIHAYKMFRTDNYAASGAYAVVLFLFLFGATLLSLKFTRIVQGVEE